MANVQSKILPPQKQSASIIIPKVASTTPNTPTALHSSVAGTGNNVFNNKCKFETNNGQKPIVVAPSLSKSELISKFDNKFKENNENMSIASRAKEEKFQELQFSAEKLHEDEQCVEKDVTNGGNGNYNNGHSNGGNGNGNKTPPKPLPRTSRNNSVSEQGTTVINPSNVEDAIGRPVARPRTSTSYKVPELN